MKKHLLLLVFALLPMFTMADEGGSCGKDVSYSFETATGTLTIQGTGDMKNYNFTLTPWRSYRSDILVVIIKDGVTNIGNSAFFDCSALSFVSIPNSVTTIGANAFYGCTSLPYIEIPNSVTSIGDRAFFGCTSLTDVEISDNVTSIGNSAFRDCTGLTSVTIGSGVKKIGNYAKLTSQYSNIQEETTAAISSTWQRHLTCQQVPKLSTAMLQAGRIS